MDSIYYLLKCDKIAVKTEGLLDTTAKTLKTYIPRSASVTVRAGSLWQRIDEFAPVDDTYEPISVIRNSTNVTLRSCEQEYVRLTCSLNDLHRLETEVDCQFLLAVGLEDDRRRLLEKDDAYQLDVGRQIFASWEDQQEGRSNDEDVKVYVYGNILGYMRYVGHLSGRVGLWFGVELVKPQAGIQGTNGSYRNKHYFDCNDHCGVFVAVNNISLCATAMMEPDLSISNRGVPANERVDSIASRSRHVLAQDDYISSLPRPQLDIGDRVVWISDFGPELGTVKWIGILPENRVKEYTIGVEFDSPIGTGTGKYNNKQLFRTRQNHASLIPCLGLMKADEFYGSSARVPPAPSFLGDLSTLSSCTTLDTASKISSRHDAASVRSAYVGDEEEDISCVTSNHVTTSVKISKRDYLDPRVDVVEPVVGNLDEWRSSTQLCQNPPDYFSVINPGGGATCDLSSEYPQADTNSTSDRSIYDQEREHCYQNVQKDETGRLLNRDTTAFCAAAMDLVIEKPARSNSGDDVSSLPVLLNNEHRNFTNADVSTKMAAMQRNSRSVDNIFNDDVDTSSRVENVSFVSGAKSTAISSDFGFEQLPYHTGRSTFYKRVNSTEDSVEKSTPQPTQLLNVGTNRRQKQFAIICPDDNQIRGRGHTGSAALCGSATVQNCFKKQPVAAQSDKCIRVDVYENKEFYEAPLNPSIRKDKPAFESSSVAFRSETPVGLPHDGIDLLHKTLGGGFVNNSIVPKPLSRAELTDKDLDVGSLVEFDVDSVTYYGVLRWIGFLTDRSLVIGGVELEEESDQGVDSVLCGTRVFECAPKKAYFELLTKLHKDRRFAESSKFVHRLPDQLFGSIECLNISGSLAPPSYGPHCLGPDRGIQGHHNSCYMDATLFSMFAFSTVFDSVLHRPRRFGVGGADIDRYDEVQLALRDGIVNPLRKNFYVRADKVLHLRQLLDVSSSVQGLMGDEKDPEEFLNSLLQQTLKADPFIHLSSGQDSYFYQLFLDKDDHIVLPTTQQLLELSFLQSDVKLSESPSCLVLQMPRFGKNYKMYKRIVPSLYLDITDVLLHGVRECAICGSLATHECKQCFHEFGESLSKIVFCDVCIRKSHNRVKRSTHQPAPLKINTDYQRMYETPEGGVPLPLSPDNIDESVREKMELFAVICIQTSHYVTFVKSGPGRQAPWLFFDSMADRKGQQHGYNVPMVECCSYLPAWLDDVNYAEIHGHRDDRSLPEQMRRLLCDAYICMYQSCTLTEYR